jgi:enoyl-[acyl-carrier protein] reductase I
MSKSFLPTIGNLMQGKRGIVMGVANDKSIAWGIAEALAKQGSQIAFSYQGEVLAKRVKPLAESIGSSMLFECDAANEESIKELFNNISKQWDSIDFIVHAIAFSDKNELKGRYIDTSLENFTKTMHISCYSLTQVAKYAEPLLNKAENGGSILSLTYYGAEKVMPHYNVMGVAKAALEASIRYLAVDMGRNNIRVNGISAGPIKTLAASGIGDFRYILKWNEYNSPLKRNTTIEEVGGSALYLLSDLGSGTSGEILHVDSGYHVVGMKAVDAPDITVNNNNEQ